MCVYIFHFYIKTLDPISILKETINILSMDSVPAKKKEKLILNLFILIPIESTNN